MYAAMVSHKFNVNIVVLSTKQTVGNYLIPLHYI